MREEKKYKRKRNRIVEKNKKEENHENEKKILGTMLLVLSIAQFNEGASKVDAELNRLLKLAKRRRQLRLKEAAKAGIVQETEEVKEVKKEEVKEKEGSQKR